ncbi:hypothetical protein BU26DRAFT_514035, partial [Trematosphaeria pertusa]
MAYYDYDSRNHHRPRHDSSYQRSRDTDRSPRHATPSTSQADGFAAMRDSVDQTSYPSSYRRSYEPRYAASPPPKRSSAQPYRYDSRQNRWPPSPSVEDEAASLAREFSSSAVSKVGEDGGEAKSRGSVDQYPIIEEIEQPQVAPTSDERRFVLVSDPSADTASTSTFDASSGRRRKSFAERGNMPHLKTDLVDDPPVFTERTSTPYAYTKPQKESLAPSAGEYFLSPEPITPSSSSVPRSVPNRDAWDARDQNAKPAKTIPIHSRYDSFTQSPRTPKNDVFEDSDVDSESTAHLRAERKPARYSFVKSDLQKEDLRANVLDSKSRSERKKQDSHGSSSSGSSKNPTPQSQSPRSSSSSLNGGTRQKSRPAPVDTDYGKSPKYPGSYPTSRPSSPRHSDAPSPPRSPRLPPRRQASPTTSRPPSRAEARPSSPLSFSTTLPSQSAGRAPVTESDWHATYPPTTTDRARPTARHGRYDSMPVPTPRIGVQSPSPARPPRAENPLPYPVDDRLTDAFMPPEEQYQFDHSFSPVAPSPRSPYPDSPVPNSPRERPSGLRPSASSRHSANPEELPRTSRTRSNSIRSQSSNDGRRERKTATVPFSTDRPLPSCPRGEPSARHNDWYTLENCPNFDLCPSCYGSVFADTPFAVYFSQTRRYERPTERFCDFSSPWMRLAWLLTIKQRRQSPDLLYALANIAEVERPCPKDRELSTDHAVWYGIPDQRDGIHVTNFAICPCDLRMMEVLFPSIRGYFTRLPSGSPYGVPGQFTCSLRTGSRRFPKYLDLLVELDAEAELLSQRPNIHRFVQMARENAFKAECARDKALIHKPWHFIPQLPEFTVCQECFEEVVWPAINSKSAPNTIPKLFNRTIQLVPGEDPELGSSCCLYSTRMRKVWERSVKEEDFGYLKRKALERKRAEGRLARERKGILTWMAGLDRGSSGWERAKAELKDNENEWKAY